MVEVAAVLRVHEREREHRMAQVRTLTRMLEKNHGMLCEKDQMWRGMLQEKERIHEEQMRSVLFTSAHSSQ